ncbi:MAG: hypothetical protein RRC07_12745, partial [Anaerolineae bacterium]|nr:hypothetical protein [Anaerolineae bacterium]
FSREEIRAVSTYVARGGHLLLVGDPTRFHVEFQETELGLSVDINNDDLPLNGLANEFGIVFRGDYLYNTTAGESEGNYRNIIVEDTAFSEHTLTAGLERVVFYGSHSLEVGAGAQPLLQTGANTWSSHTQRAGELALAATGAAGRVLALGDLTFLTDPYNRVYDNARFIAHIADFLVQPARDYVLADFPYTFDQTVDLVFLGAPALGPRAYSSAGRLEEQLAASGRDLTLRSEPQDGHDALYLGLYSQAGDVSGLLDTAGISLLFDPPLVDESSLSGEDQPVGEDLIRRIASPLGNIEMAGTALFQLVQDGEQGSLVVLAASGEGLSAAAERLLENARVGSDTAFADCLLQDTLALCPTYLDGETVETQLDLTGPVERTLAPPGADEPAGAPGLGAYIEAIDAVAMGTISLGQTRTGDLAPTEAHAWTFAGGPALITLTLETGETVDAVLQVYDDDYELVEGVDEALAGEPETLADLFVPAGATYTIVVRAFFGNAGSYSLHLEGEQTSAPPPVESAIASILVFSDDDGDAQGDGRTGAETIASLLEDLGEFTIHRWSAVDDGPLDADTLAGYDLVVWASGDFRSSDQFEDDSFLLTLYFATGGRLLVTGATPAFLESPGLEFAQLADLEVEDVDPPFLPGINVGTIIPLDEPVTAALLSGLSIAEDEALTPVLLRGPESEESGEPVAVAIDNPDNDGLLFLLAAPFDGLPRPAQEALLEGLVHWFELQ